MGTQLWATRLVTEGGGKILVDEATSGGNATTSSS